MGEREEMIVKVTTIITLGVIVLASVVMIGIVSVMTDREMARAEYLSFGGAILLAALGGVSWWQLRRRRRWHVKIDRNGENGGE